MTRDAMDSYVNIRCIIRKKNLLAHFFIWAIALVDLILASTVFSASLFGIGFLIFFLVFVLTFQGCYCVWARTIQCYCWLLIVYSTSVSIITYAYQYGAVNTFFKQILDDQLLQDIGLVVKSAWGSFLESSLTLLLAAVLFIYVRIFSNDLKRFSYLAEEEDVNLSAPLTGNLPAPAGQQTINDSTFIMLRTSSITRGNIQDEQSKSREGSNRQSLHSEMSNYNAIATTNLTTVEHPKVQLRRVASRVKFQNFLKATTECIWRILETHYIKVVLFMIFRLAIVEVCLMSSPFPIIVIIALIFPSTSKFCCLLASWLISFIVTVRNLSELSFLRIYDIENTCDASAPPALQNNAYSILPYIGINHSAGNPLNGVRNQVLVLILITIQSFINMHYERRSVKSYELSLGVIFTGVGRREADQGLFNTIKYFCNFGFYNFGIEITCLALVIAISNRLDVVAAVYGIILTISSITTSRRTLASIWPILTLLVSLLVPVQYALRLGFPKSLCEYYPWYQVNTDYKYWLFLSDYQTVQNERFLLFDFLVLLAITRQSNVFRHMTLNTPPPVVTSGNLERPSYMDHDSNETRLRYLPGESEFTVEDCFSNYSSQGNYLKSIFFMSIYWITLAVVLVAGATKISLFSLGYLLGCFIFLWLGNDAYLMAKGKLCFSWNLLIFYATFVIFSKVILQLVACYLHDYLMGHCYILQLLRIVCYRKMNGLNPNAATIGNVCSLPYDELDILWDGLCLMFLLLQRVVFGSQYFGFLVREVEAQQILASRGAELIMATQIEEAKSQALYEREVMRSVREKMENLKSDNEETSKAWKRLLELPHHHQIIRNADKHLFNNIDDNTASTSQSADWKFKRAFIPDPLGDELERMSNINGISSVFTRWMKGQPLYGGGGSASSNAPSSPRDGSPEHDSGPAPGDAEPLRDNDQDSSDPREQIIGSFENVSEEDGTEVGRMRGWWDMINLIVYSCLLSATVSLNKLSRSYRYVSRRLAVEKNILKQQYKLDDDRFKKDLIWRKSVINTVSETYTKSNNQYMAAQSNTSLHRIRSALRVIESNNGAGSSQDSNQSIDLDRSPAPGSSSQKLPQSPRGAAELTDPEYHFLKLNIFTQFCRAVAYVFISNTSLLCQIVIIFNQVLTASLLSLPLPLLTFLWGTLSVPRPTKRFWKTVITYTELVIVIKYVCQFPIWNWESSNINPFYFPNLLGVKDISIVNDLFLLLSLFFHRSMLKSLGQWDASVHEGSAFMLDNQKGGDEIQQVPTPEQLVSLEPEEGEESPPAKRLVKSYAMEDDITKSSETSEKQVARASSIEQLAYNSRTYNDHLQHSYQNDEALVTQEIELEENQKLASSASCRGFCVRAYYRTKRSIALFFQHVLNTPYKVQTDVYTWMFLCDFINFLILIYGFWAFGSGYTNQTVASFLDENRIPFSVLIMLLAQFASIIIDRAFYLQKNIASKITFQVVLVIGIHAWLFFALPFATGHALTLKDNWPPKAWYVIKCIYFLLSAHQIRSGYPRRVLGNCFTKSYGYANWGAFKVYRAIPLVYDLRLYMDWIWTETTLEFRNWSLMEDMAANLFIRKCELTLEEEYPQPRAKPIRHISKYLTGGTFILLILAIIWGPLLLFSMGKTVGDRNPPVEMEYELEFVGFQPILRMRATSQQITFINDAQYDQLKARFVSLSSQSFLGDYKVGDVAVIRLDGQSNAVWEISPPSKDLLMTRIQGNETITLKSTWTLYRIKKEKSQNFDVSISGTHQFDISGNSSQQFRSELYNMLANSSTTQTAPNEVRNVTTPPIFPNYLRVPETGQVTLVDQFDDNIYEYNSLRPLILTYIRSYDDITKHPDDSNSWWRADDPCKTNPANDSYPFWSPETFDHCESLVTVTFNNRIFTGLLALLSAPGIIGLYTTFVVFFARLIRTEPSGKVIYTEIPKVDRVYGLIMDIYMMRECGEFELEEKLFAKLLFLYRSPEMLIEWSQRHDDSYLTINNGRGSMD